MSLCDNYVVKMILHYGNNMANRPKMEPFFSSGKKKWPDKLKLAGTSFFFPKKDRTIIEVYEPQRVIDERLFANKHHCMRVTVLHVRLYFRQSRLNILDSKFHPPHSRSAPVSIAPSWTKPPTWERRSVVGAKYILYYSIPNVKERYKLTGSNTLHIRCLIWYHSFFVDPLTTALVIKLLPEYIVSVIR